MAGSINSLVPLSSDENDSKNDVLCIVYDETSLTFDQRSKYNFNFPRSTSILELYKKTGEEFGYDPESFLLVWKSAKAGHESEERELTDNVESLQLEEVCQPPEKKKHQFYLRKKNGNPPTRVKPPAQV